MIRDARFPEDREVVADLIREYGRSLDVDLGFQHFHEELAALPGDYGPPRGAVLLAINGEGTPMGCVALRPISPTIAEMKRLFVVPLGRGQGVGKALIDAIIDRARALRYHYLRLDTLPSQVEAQRLYADRGFTDIAPYRHNPIEGSRFLELKLVVGPT